MIVRKQKTVSGQYRIKDYEGNYIRGRNKEKGNQGIRVSGMLDGVVRVGRRDEEKRDQGDVLKSFCKVELLYSIYRTPPANIVTISG